MKTMKFGSLIDYSKTQASFNNIALGLTSKKDKVRQFGLLESPNISHFDGEVSHKIFVCGKSGSGKTSLLLKLAGMNSSTTSLHDTLGINVMNMYWPVFIKETKKLILFKLCFWDCGEAYLNSYHHLLSSCLEQVDCVFYNFSLNSKAMYDDLPKLISRINVPDTNDESVLKILTATNFQQLKEPAEVSIQMKQDLEQVWKIPVLTFQSQVQMEVRNNKKEYLHEISFFLNKLCELLWYHDQVKGGLFPKSTVDYCFHDDGRFTEPFNFLSLNKSQSRVTFC